MITSKADVSCTPIGPPLLKSRPPLQTQASNTTNIRVPGRATPPGFHRSTNRHHATQQNGKHHFCHAQHHRLTRYGIEDCFYSPDAQRKTPIQRLSRNSYHY
ncbi:hypothetical protein TNCV_1607271 [Trichonephila clavipes]|nr:hypothetical protein TNCV_1607271 [Trichonephila clavipes]